MIDKTKRHIWPVALVAVLAVAGLMASLIVLSSPPGMAQAQGLCDTASGATLAALIEAGVCQADDGTDPGSGTNGDGTNGRRHQWQRRRPAWLSTMLESSSTSANANVKITLTMVTLTDRDVDKLASDGGSVELYLEDDFVVPDSISRPERRGTLPSPRDSRRNGRPCNGRRPRSVMAVVVERSAITTRW